MTAMALPLRLAARPRAPKLALGREGSPACVKVARALRLLELPFGEAEGAVLVFDGEPMQDAGAIFRRLDRLVPGVLVPREPRLAAEAWIYAELAERSLHPFVLGALWVDPKNWPAVRDARFGRASWLSRTFVAPRVRAEHAYRARRDDLGPLLDALEERAPYEGFWVSAAPTVADLGLFAELDALRSPLTARQAQDLARRPKLSDWLDRVEQATR